MGSGKRLHRRRDHGGHRAPPWYYQPMPGITTIARSTLACYLLFVPNPTAQDCDRCLGKLVERFAPPVTVDFDGGPSRSARPLGSSGCHWYSAAPKVIRSTGPEKKRSHLDSESAKTTFNAWSLS